MTYAEIKNQFTTVETVDNRLAEIKNLAETGRQKSKEVHDAYVDAVNAVLAKFNVENYHCTEAGSMNVYFERNDADTFYNVGVRAYYDYDWNTKETTWKVELNVSSYGNFSLIGNNDEKEQKVVDYYAMISLIVGNQELKKELNEVCQKNVDAIREVKKTYFLTSEEQQLNILRNNLIKEAAYGKMLVEVMEASDKTQLVVVKKNVEKDEADGTRKGELIKVMTEPMPNTPETRPEVDKKLKEIAKNNEGKFTLTQIRFIKFEK